MILTAKRLLLILMPLLVTGCAMRVAPSGGERDKTSAIVSGTSPVSGTTMFSDKSIRFEFDDYVDRSIKSAVTVQPTTPFYVDYAGDVVTVEFKQDLEPNTTYVVTLGTEYTDIRGNKPAEAYSIVFATGADIDTGKIAGSIDAKNTSGLWLFVYPDADTLSSSFTPQFAKPRYKIPIGSSGAFIVNGLADGLYRVVAVRDANTNDLVDANEDFGVATQDIRVPQDTAAKLTIPLGAAIDVVPPSATRVRALSSTNVELLFSEPVRIDMSTLNLAIADSTGKSVPIITAYQPNEPGNELMMMLRSTLQNGMSYSVRFDTSAVSDTNTLLAAAPTKALTFRGTDKTVTGSLFIQNISLIDSTVVTADSSLTVMFSDAIDTAKSGRLMAHYSHNTDTVAGIITWKSLNKVSVRPSTALAYNITYKLQFGLQGLRSFDGDTLPDSTIVRKLTILSRVDSGAIELSVKGRPLGDNMMLTIINAQGMILRALPVKAGDSLSVKGLPPGEVRFAIFNDMNSNTKFDYGRIRPYQAAEPRITFDRIVTVRPRWTVDGIILEIP